MKHGTCATCGAAFVCNTKGRPAKYCTIHRSKHGHAHRKARAAALGDFTLGQGCVRCGRPILDVSDAEYDHADDDSGDYLGFAHARCNAAAGARKLGEINRRARAGLPAALGVTPTPATISPGQELAQTAHRKGPAYVSSVSGALVRTCTCPTLPGPHEVSAGLVGSRCW